MKFILERVSEPDIEPVTLAEMKRHLKCFDSVTDEDDDIAALITVAREWAEAYTGRAMIDQSWRLTIDQHGYLAGDDVGGRPGYCSGRFQWARVGEIMLRKAPALAITSFVTVDANGVETAVDVDTYELREADSKWPRIVALSGATWTTGAMRITFRAGFADRLGSPQEDATVVPQRFKQAIKLYVEAHYDRDPAMMERLIDAARNLIKSERSELSIA